MDKSQDILGSWSIGHFACGVMFALIYGAVFKSGVVFGVVFGVILHQLFEIWENQSAGKAFWNDSKIKKGLKAFGIEYDHYDGDSALNSAGDTLCFTLGLGLVCYFRTK